MRRILVVSVVAALLLVTGCARERAGGPAADPPSTGSAAGDWPAGVKEADVYVQVLRRYLGTPSDNSFPDQTFKTVYVLDRAHPDAGDPTPDGGADKSTPITVDIQRPVVAALSQQGVNLTFIADKNTVLEDPDGCAKVKNDGILITLGTVNGDDNSVQVGVNGFVACLGTTWLTYVVQNDVGTGWHVTGTTGPMAIS